LLRFVTAGSWLAKGVEKTVAQQGVMIPAHQRWLNRNDKAARGHSLMLSFAASPK
jgi:hypothetical protein